MREREIRNDKRAKRALDGDLRSSQDLQSAHQEVIRTLGTQRMPLNSLSVPVCHWWFRGFQPGAKPAVDVV